MIKIIKATIDHAELIAEIGKLSFWESHGISASKTDISTFISKTYTKDKLLGELENLNNIYHLIYYNNKVAGFSKVIFNSPNENIDGINITKMERLYLLKEYYGLGLGLELFNFNVTLSKKNHQSNLQNALLVF